MSAGIGMFPKKYPVKAMARQTEELESASKDMPGKDAVSLFGGENTINKTPRERKFLGNRRHRGIHI